ncbi:MAG: diguanylate cyclase, partial [Butyricicoccus pullicaecorum]|nr:diguanylate cyclase [Butyricicoccus pullicaecorum]
MFRSLHMKLVLILILLIVSVMAVMGTFLINSVGNYYLKDFYSQVDGLFDYNMRVSLSEAAKEPDGDQRLALIVSAYTSL